MTQARSTAISALDARQRDTLRLLGTAAVHQADPAAAWSPAERQLLRLTTRQLVSYPGAADPTDWRALGPVGDLAVDVPSTYNAGLGASHRSYVAHLRPDVWWDSPQPRRITAHDVVRGFKRLANPVTRHPALPYFRSTIRGMDRYCDEYAAVVAGRPVTAALLAAFANAHDLPGVFALDDETVVIELLRPALDFPDMLALSCASPAPAEYDAYLPGSTELHAHLVASGPYRVATWQPGDTIRLEPNPTWRPESDPVRHQRFDAVEFRVSGDGPRRLADQISADVADLPWGVPVGEVSGYRADPFLVFNLRDPANPAMSTAAVRQVIDEAIDRSALARIARVGDPWSAVREAYTVVPPGNDGHLPSDPAADPPAHGTPRERLAAAGHPNGLLLTAVCPDRTEELALARAWAADLAMAGIEVRLVALDEATHRALLTGAAGAPAQRWDVSTTSWTAPWGYGNARVFLQPLVDGARPSGHRDEELDRMVEQAVDAADPREAVACWQQVQRRLLADAAVVPLLFRRPTDAAPRGPRVRRADALPSLGGLADLGDVRLGNER
ncbi:ABC transporter substrate-binding protein [Salinispora arenicola]|uniref:ABC transporter substrate-binding protein n=1 Tax=Salinispora arenicola TaxID=168697 RepID=UPI000375723B|nr:ABC transporter substrate-binding protein [Salinispora arenicola]